MRKFLLLVACGLSGLAIGQTPMTLMLDHNPALTGHRPVRKAVATGDTLKLPFIDDFWYYDSVPYPNERLWKDKYVFINNNFPKEPRSNGVATFDALNENGKMYAGSSSSFAADTLTSQPIDLGEAGIANVYLSFFYQPQGYGDAPEEGDELILQFRAPDSTWSTEWRTPGSKLTRFKPAVVAVTGKHLYKGFQFRFVNMVSFADDPNAGKRSNMDIWNLDYVRLDKNRNENDTAALDVAMIKPLHSMLKGYTSVPWSHFQVASNNLIQSRISMTYRNNDVVDYLVKRTFDITDLYFRQTYPLGNQSFENIFSGETFTQNEETLNPFANSPAVDSALFELRGYLSTNEHDRKQNDTVRLRQEFNNYFARDDGVPEGGCGYEGINPQGASLACRYESFIPDTLRAVAIYFNAVEGNVTAGYVFRIAVWKDSNDPSQPGPGEQIYLSPEYSPKTTGQYVIYPIAAKLFIGRGKYWIGLTQVTTGFLNVGLDLSYDDVANIWFDSPGVWTPNAFHGTMMMRPYMGSKTFVTSAPSKDVPALHIYPNPACDRLYIDLDAEDRADYQLEIFTIVGQRRYNRRFTGNPVDVSRLEEGMYIISLRNTATGKRRTEKIVIDR